MLNINTQKLNQHLNQHSSIRTAHVCVCLSLCTTVVHNTARNSSDNFPSYPPDNYRSSNNVYWGKGEWRIVYTLSRSCIIWYGLVGCDALRLGKYCIIVMATPSVVYLLTGSRPSKGRRAPGLSLCKRNVASVVFCHRGECFCSVHLSSHVLSTSGFVE